MNKKSWEHRLQGSPDELAVDFVESLSVDVRLYKYDIAGSIAHSQMLAEQKLISKDEFKAIKDGLLEISHEIAEGKFKFDWEKDYLEFSKNIVGMASTFEQDISYAKTMLENNAKPEFEMYELGHIGYVTWLMAEGLVKKPPHLQFVFGPIVGWMKPSVKHLVLMYEEAKELLGEGNFTWSVAGAGRWQIPLAATAMAMGAPNVRVGMEDSLYAGDGTMATSSADQVQMVVNIAKEMSLTPATPNEARETLGVKGLDKVAF